MDFEKARKRVGIVNQIRSFFDQRNYLEVETPLLSPYLIPESNIENFTSELLHPYKESIPMYLTPSPEIWMKVLIAKGAGNIYQISKSFRNSEQISPIHNPEFSMLEWYCMDIKAEENIQICEDLVHSLIQAETPEYCKAPFRHMTMEEAFCEYAGFSLEKNLEEEALREQLTKHEIPWNVEESWEVLFNKLFLTLVETELPKDKPLVLKDYPSRLETLSQSKADTPWSDRWELYINGVEVANCYTEETDQQRIYDFVQNESRMKQLQSLTPISDASDWLSMLKDFPACSGTAIGIDRLVAALLGDKSIQGVILFPLSDILPRAKND